MLIKGSVCFAPSFVGTPLTQQHEILSRNTRNSKLSYGENPKSLFHLSWNGTGTWHQDRQTDGRMNRQTDRITVANTVAHKNQLSMPQFRFHSIRDATASCYSV